MLATPIDSALDNQLVKLYFYFGQLESSFFQPSSWGRLNVSSGDSLNKGVPDL